MSNEWMKNRYLLITYYLLLITPESPTVHGGEDVNRTFVLGLPFSKEYLHLLRRGDDLFQSKSLLC
jgi:hypothetical protein